MQTKTYSLPVNLPTVEEFAERFPQYGNFARNEGRFLFETIVSPESFNNAQVVTIGLNLPAVAGIAEICYQTVSNHDSIRWEERKGFLKQYIGAVVCKLMEVNGFEKTGVKKSVPHRNFTKGEVYHLVE